jgi:predicted RNA-binding protein YlqC (UPF0109 family)
MRRRGVVKKSEIVELLRDLPEEIDVEKLIYTLYVRRQIEIGLADADAGRFITHQEFEKLSEEWLK